MNPFVIVLIIGILAAIIFLNTSIASKKDKRKTSLEALAKFLDSQSEAGRFFFLIEDGGDFEQAR